MNIFLGRETIPNFHFASSPVHQIVVKAETQSIRPYVVGAVLRNVTLTHNSYNSFLDLQDKLHFNICRKYVFITTSFISTIYLLKFIFIILFIYIFVFSMYKILYLLLLLLYSNKGVL